MAESEDAAYARGLAACRRACAPHVHEQCFQRDGTRHVTIYRDLRLSPLEAARVAFVAPPRLPVTLTLTLTLTPTLTPALTLTRWAAAAAATPFG